MRVNVSYLYLAWGLSSYEGRSRPLCVFHTFGSQSETYLLAFDFPIYGKEKND
jgi:hypothetical protein